MDLPSNWFAYCRGEISGAFDMRKVIHFENNGAFSDVTLRGGTQISLDEERYQDFLKQFDKYHQALITD